MKKLLISVLIVLFCFGTAIAKPFISTNSCERVEEFKIIINDKIVKTIQPQTNDSLHLDVATDLGIKQVNSKVKITIVAINSDGDSDVTSFYLRIFKFFNYYVYRIEPIEEPDNPLYLDKYELKQLEVRMFKKW